MPHMITIYLSILILLFIMSQFIHPSIKNKKQQLNCKYRRRYCFILLIFLSFIFILIINSTTKPPLAILYCLFASALLLLSIIDLLTYEIPIQINLFIGILGIVRILIDPANLKSYLIGFF